MKNVSVADLLKYLNWIKEKQTPILKEKYDSEFKRLSPDWEFELSLDGSGYFYARQSACGEYVHLYGFSWSNLNELQTIIAKELATVLLRVE